MRKLLSTDLDGTIVFNAAISREDLDAMARWRAAGNLLVPNTGRSVSALRTALDGSHLTFDYSVALHRGRSCQLRLQRSEGLHPARRPGRGDPRPAPGRGRRHRLRHDARRRPSALRLARLRHASAHPVLTGLLHRPARTHPRRRPPAHSRCGAPGAHSGRDRAPLGRDRHGLPQPELPRHRSPRLLQGRGPEGAGRPPYRRRRPLLGREHRDLERRRFVERYPHASGRRPRRRHE